MNPLNKKDILDNLDKFIALDAIAKQGSIRSAAQTIRISQPSLSVKMRNLESILGVRLLTRSRNGIYLTSEGKIAHEFSKEIIEKTEDFLRRIYEKGPLRGDVRIGVYDSIARYFWPSFFKYFSKKYPNVSMTLITGRSSRINELLLENEVDIGLVVGATKSAYLKTESLYKDDFSFFCSPGFSNQFLVGKQNVPLSLSFLREIEQKLPLILFSQASYGNKNALESSLPHELLSQFNIHRVENFEIARAFCTEGLGISILPNKVVESSLKTGKLIRISMSRAVEKNFSSHTIELSTRNSSLDGRLLYCVHEEIVNFIQKGLK